MLRVVLLAPYLLMFAGRFHWLELAQKDMQIMQSVFPMCLAPETSHAAQYVLLSHFKLLISMKTLTLNCRYPSPSCSLAR